MSCDDGTTFGGSNALISLSTSFGWSPGAVVFDVFPRLVMESNALCFSVGQPLAGFLVKSVSDLRKSL